MSLRIPPAFFSAFRIVYLSLLFLRFALDRSIAFNRVRGTNYYHPLPSFEWLGIERIPTSLYEILYWALLGLLLIAIEGRWAKWALPAVAGTAFLVLTTNLGFDKSPHNPYVPHNQNVNMLFLILLAGMPRAYHLTLKETWADLKTLWRGEEPARSQVSAQPVMLFRYTLALAYFGSVYCRWQTSGWEWLDGKTMQTLLLERSVLLDLPYLQSIAAQPGLCVALTWLLFFFEATFVFAIWHPLSFLIYLAGGVVFHYSVLQTMGINFVSTHMLSYCIGIVDLGVFIRLARPRAVKSSP